MSDPVVIPVPPAWAAKAFVDDVKYRAWHASALADPEAFWGVHGQRVDWTKPYTKVKDTSFNEADFRIRWYEDGVLNVSANCIDRHLETRGDQVAIIWEGDDPEHAASITYRELHAEVCRFANVLKANGVTKGDVVTIYMPMIPEAAYAMLACARIGAIHSVVFGGFSPESLANRIKDCNSKVIVTADEGVRGGKIIPLKANVDAACELAPSVGRVVVVTRTGAGVPLQSGRDVIYEDEAQRVVADCPPEPMNAEDPLLILYTSGSTGKPKGVLHTTGG
jgi:acetyl-CoA synthetase